MLRRRGLSAWTVEGGEGHVVLVPRERRDEALQLVAASMDDLAARHDDRAPRAVEDPIDDDEPGRRLLLPRLRDGGIVILIVPLLVVALSAVNFPARYAALVVVVGIAIVFALRIRARGDE